MKHIEVWIFQEDESTSITRFLNDQLIRQRARKIRIINIETIALEPHQIRVWAEVD